MPIITPPAPSIEAAHETALNDYLALALGFPFNYPEWAVQPSDSPKGIARIVSSGETITGNMRVIEAIADIRLTIAHTDAVEGYRLLKDWGSRLTTAMKQIREDGITGTYRGFTLTNACAGIKPIERMGYPSRDTSQGQAIASSDFVGYVLGKYSFTIEQIQLDEWL
jgi:hypothetical protein